MILKSDLSLGDFCSSLTIFVFHRKITYVSEKSLSSMIIRLLYQDIIILILRHYYSIFLLYSDIVVGLYRDFVIVLSCYIDIF